MCVLCWADNGAEVYVHSLIEQLESPEQAAAWFEKIDTNGDGVLDVDEIDAFVSERFEHVTISHEKTRLSVEVRVS